MTHEEQIEYDKLVERVAFLEENIANVRLELAKKNNSSKLLQINRRYLRSKLKQLDYSYQRLSDLEFRLSHAPVAEMKDSPTFGERLLLLILTKDERVNIPGDLEEEYRGIAAKHGERFAKVWYYKQVAASAWPMVRKAVGWGLMASIGAWIRKFI